MAEPEPEGGGQLGQGAAQAVGTVGDAKDGKGQDEDEQGGHYFFLPSSGRISRRGQFSEEACPSASEITRSIAERAMGQLWL